MSEIQPVTKDPPLYISSKYSQDKGHSTSYLLKVQSKHRTLHFLHITSKYSHDKGPSTFFMSPQSTAKTNNPPLSLYLLKSTECGNITSYVVMRGNQAVEVVSGWACFHTREDILKFPWKYSQSYHALEY